MGVRTRSLSQTRLRYIRQLGATDVFIDHANVDEEPDEFNDREADVTLDVGEDTIPTVEQLETAKAHVEAADLRLAGVHSLPFSLYGEVMFGRDGADEAIEQITTLIEHLGDADVPILGYQWNPRGLVPMRTDPVELRGGAIGTGFDYDELEAPDELAPGLNREYTEDEFWENFQGFLETVLPIAEDAGVDLALHPIDPPVIETMCGIPRLCRNVESFERAMDLVPSENHGLKLCLGCFSQMGEDVNEVIRTFADRDQIVFVHFRDVEGTVPRFHETFVDEGNFDTTEVVRTLHDVGYEGAILPDHVPLMEDDTDWRHRARAFTVGYLRGVIDTVEADTVEAGPVEVGTAEE